MGNVELHSAGVRIAGQLFLPDSGRFTPPYPGVVVCHGIGSCKENQFAFDDHLVQNGFAVLGFDFRGHGESEGVLDEQTVEDALTALDFLAARPEVDEQRLALRGSSMGGFFALRAAARDPRVRALAVIAPAFDEFLAMGVESGYLQHLLEREHMKVRLEATSFLRGVRSCRTQDIIPQLASRALLFIQCRGDELVPFTWTEELFAQAKEPKRLILLEGGHHRLAQQDIGMHQATSEWFREYLSA